jgi:hypothetical protein
MSSNDDKDHDKGHVLMNGRAQESTGRVPDQSTSCSSDKGSIPEEAYLYIKRGSIHERFGRSLGF